MVRDAEPEREATLADRLDGQRLLGQRDRMPGLHRHNGGADLDARRLEADQGDRGQRVELVGDLWDPHRGQTRFLGPPCVGPHALDLGGVAPSLGADHETDPHRPTSVLRTTFFV